MPHIDLHTSSLKGLIGAIHTFDVQDRSSNDFKSYAKCRYTFIDLLKDAHNQFTIHL